MSGLVRDQPHHTTTSDERSNAGPGVLPGPFLGGTMSQSLAKLTEMNILKAIAVVAAPVVLANLGQTAVEWTTLGMLGTLGAESLAAVGFSRNVFWWATSWLWAVGMGIMALVSRSIGANDPERARRTIVQALLAGGVITAATAAIGMGTASFALSLLGAEPSVLWLGQPYLRMMFLSAPFMINFHFCVFALRAMGETQTTFWLQGIVGVAQLVLSRMLIFGWGPLPALRLVGGGLAIVISRAIGLVAVLYVLMSGRSRIRIAPKDLWFRPDWPTISTLFRVSMPNAVEWLGADTQKVILLRIIASTGAATFAVSAVTVGRQVEELYGMVGMGLATAAGTLVGQNLGARKPDRATESANKTSTIAIALFAVFGLAFVLLPGRIMRLFCDDIEVIGLGVWYLRMLGIVGPAYAASIVFAGSLRGAADTRSPMKIALISLWVIQLPLSYFLGLRTPLSLYGIYLAFAVFWVIQGIWLKRRFDKGHWKEIAV